MKENWMEGPWRVGDRRKTVFGPPNGNVVPEIIADIRRPENSAFIAAAPELYAALEAFCFAASFDGLTKDKAWRELLSQGRSALAKARGEGK